MDEYGNPLYLYEPLIRNKKELKALTQMPHQSGRSSYVPMYNSWAGWDAARSGNFEGTNIDYAAKVGDLSKSSLIMSAVRVVGNTLPEAPLEVKDPGDGKGDAVVVESELIERIRKPNDYYAGDALWTAFGYSWLVDGNVYLIKIWNKAGTKVVELWYEPHWSIRPRWYNDNQGGLDLRDGDDRDAFILYYELDRGNRKYRLETTDVMHFKDGLDPFNPRCGWSYIRSVYREIYGDGEVSNFQSRLFGGSAVPPFMVEIDPDVQFDGEKARLMADDLERKTSGDRRGKPIVVYGGKPHKLSWSPSELDLKMLHRFSEERFCAVTGIPAEVLQLGVGKDHNIYNNYSEGQRAYYESYLKPLYRRIASQVNRSLLPDFETNPKLYTAHDLSKISALQESEDLKWKRLGAAYQNGGIKRSEYRSGMGFDIDESADNVYLVRSGASTVSPDAEQPEEPAQLRLVKAIASKLIKPNGHEHEFKGLACSVCQKSMDELISEVGPLGEAVGEARESINVREKE